MRNYGATLTEAELINALTCEADTSAQVSNYSQLLPPERYATSSKNGVFYAYDEYTRGWYEFGITNKGERINFRAFTTLSDVTNWWEEVLGEGAFRPTSQYIYNSLTRKRVHPELMPYFTGNAAEPAPQGLVEAESRRAMAIREEMVKDFSVRMGQSALDAYSSTLSSALKSGLPTEVAQQKANEAVNEATDISKNDVYVGNESGGSNEDSILPKILTMVAFAGIGFGAAWLRGRYK